jgi:predicted TIM-barrel fold metal-dependent hydrolase
MNSDVQHIVDTHCHVISENPSLFPIEHSVGGKQSDWSKNRPVNVDGMKEAMLQAGVSKSVLVQASTCYGHDSSYVAHSVKSSPKCFIGVCSVDFLDPKAIEHLQHWLELGVKGVRVFIAGHTAADDSKRIDDPKAFALWDWISEKQIPICVQLRSNGLASLSNLLKQFPKAIVLLDHFARPELSDGEPYKEAQSLFDLAQYSGLHFKYTTHNVRDSLLGQATPSGFIKKAVQVFGSSRIAWGSNFPACDRSLAEQLQEGLRATSDLSLSDREWIFTKTAHQLYPSLNSIPGL